MSDRKNSNGIINSFVVISEAFHHIDIGEDNIIRFLDNRFFIQMFESIPDFRQQEKIRYKLSNLLMMIFLTVLERGKTSYVIIADVIEAKKRTYESLGLIENGQCPSHDTIRRILSLLNSEGLRENTIQAFYFFLQCLERNFLSQGDYKHMAFDGKEMRGSGRASDAKKPKRNTAMLVKVYDKTNLKLFSPLMYGSDEWKEVYKNRTSTERINNRILNDFGLHALTCRNGSKHFFFAILAGVNIHLDAWAKADRFS